MLSLKIQDAVRINRGEFPLSTPERVSSQSPSFQKIMNSYSKEITQDHLSRLLEDIDQQGQKLSETPTFRELQKYKELVKKFMGEASKNGVALYQSESWDLYGGNKTLKTVRVIDQKMIELTDQVLNQQKDGLSILERIGEMKGLLINLYT